MAPSPVPLVIIIVVFLVVEGLVYGEELAEASFGLFTYEVTPPEDCDGVLDAIACAITAAVNAVLGFINVVLGSVAFFFNFITFNIPGAPWWVRVPTGFAFTSAFVWIIASWFRGN